MYPLKQSTAITVPVFVHDASGDGVTGLVDAGFTKRISKNGGAFAAMTVTITEMENGWYSVPISTAHSDTTGILTVTLTHASSKQVNLQWRVDANLPDDLDADLTNIEADTQDIQGRLPAALVSGRIDSSVGAVAAGAIGAAGFAAGAIDATALATDAAEEIADTILGRSIAGGANGGRDIRSALRRIRNRNAIAGGTLTVYLENDTGTAWTAAVTTAAGNPISEIDPA
jgi:hypothetical protein